MGASAVRAAITLYTIRLVEAYAQGGSFDAAQAAIEEALLVNPQERFFRPVSVRQRGEIRARLGMLGDAERDFREALALANQMGGKRFGERAMRSLQHLVRQYARTGADALGITATADSRPAVSPLPYPRCYCETFQSHPAPHAVFLHQQATTPNTCCKSGVGYRNRHPPPGTRNSHGQ